MLIMVIFPSQVMFPM